MTTSSPALTIDEIKERISFYAAQLVRLSAGSAANRMSREEWAENIFAVERKLAALRTALKLQQT